MRVSPEVCVPAGHDRGHGRGPSAGLDRSECLCLEWFPFEKKCICQVPLPASVARQRSMPELKGKEQTQPQARNRLMMKEFRKLGLKGVPAYQRMRGSTMREGLLRARASGDLGVLRSTVRAARTHLGLDDPLVKLVGKVLSEVERCARMCRDCFPLGSLQALPSAMSKIESILLRVHELAFSGLGSQVWEDPWLGSARRKLDAWKKHRPELEGMAAKLQKGAATYCDAWAQLALGSSGLKAEFGTTVTQEILSLPDAGARLAGAISKAFGKLPAAPEATIDATRSSLTLISHMLSQLDRSQLDDLVLKPGSNSGSSLQAAASLEDILVFSSLYQTVTGEVVEIQRDLLQNLEKEAKTMPQQSGQLPAAIIGEMLQLDPREVCLRSLPTGGSTLRLLVAAGHPVSQYAQEVLGSGASAQPWRRLAPRSEELAKWHTAGDIVRQLYELQRRCCNTRGAAERAEAAEAEEVGRLEAAKARASELEEESARAASRSQEAKESMEAAWQKFVSAMEETRETMRRGSVVQAEEDAAKARDADAETKHKAAKKRAEDAEVVSVEAAKSYEEAKRLVVQVSEKAELAMEASIRASAEAAADAKRYQELLRMPLASTLVDSRSGAKLKPVATSQRQRGKRSLRPH